MWQTFSSAEKYLNKSKQQVSQLDIVDSLRKAVEELSRDMKRISQDVERLRRDMHMMRRRSY
jgi:hypothetical protein